MLWSGGNKNRSQFLVPSRIENYLPDSMENSGKITIIPNLVSNYRSEISQFPNRVMFILIPYSGTMVIYVPGREREFCTSCCNGDQPVKWPVSRSLSDHSPSPKPELTAVVRIH